MKTAYQLNNLCPKMILIGILYIGKGGNPKALTLNSGKVDDINQNFGPLLSFSILFETGFMQF